MNEKKYKSIKDVALLLDVNPHVIRYWDSKFDGISTRIDNNKKRFFNNENIKKLKDLKNILYQNGKHNYSLDLAKKIINKSRKSTFNDFEVVPDVANLSLKKNDIIKLVNISKNLKKLLH